MKKGFGTENEHNIWKNSKEQQWHRGNTRRTVHTKTLSSTDILSSVIWLTPFCRKTDFPTHYLPILFPYIHREYDLNHEKHHRMFSAHITIQGDLDRLSKTIAYMGICWLCTASVNLSLFCSAQTSTWGPTLNTFTSSFLLFKTTPLVTVCHQLLKI